MVLEGQEEVDLEVASTERAQIDSSDDDDDDDQDMSDGGVALDLVLSHAQQLNAEMDMLDAEIMGPENLAGLVLASYYQQPTTNFTSTEVGAPLSTLSHQEPPFALNQDDLMMDGTGPNVPTALSEVSQQLQHIQEGQEQADMVDIMVDHTTNFVNNMEDQFNLSLGDFLYRWGMAARQTEDSKKRSRGPALAALHNQRFVGLLDPVQRRDLLGESCDIQNINWKELGVTRAEARQMRRSTYKNYTNLRFPPDWHPRLTGVSLPEYENFFRFRYMDFDHDVHLSHFQLRNLLAATSRDQIFYAGRSKVLQFSPSRGEQIAGPISVAIDLTHPDVQPFHAFPGGVQISTLTSGHDILVAGGFSGEYGLVNLKAHRTTKHVEGLITDHHNSITNHIQVQLSRSSTHPRVAFASNDSGMRILDVCTNKFIAEHKYSHAINCTAISPDQRLRVLVGDVRNVLICNSETGEVLQELEGHKDFGFACDWADDGYTVATGNQDMQVMIWDARKWKTNRGVACPVRTIAADLAGVRSLKFSPLGSGKKVLVAAEPADLVHVIDAETFRSKQTLSFFGEIGGIDFANDGRDLIVANCDHMRGGILEFERCDFASESLYGYNDDDDEYDDHRFGRAPGYDWKPTLEEVVHHPKSRGTAMQRTMRAARLGDMPIF